MSAGATGQRWVRWGRVVAVAIGLGATAHGVFDPGILAHYSESPDSVIITRWAERATVDDALGWWVGPWIQADSPYYRPLSSLLFWFEYLVFGWDFQGHVIISWILHGWICWLLYELALRLLHGEAVRRAALALVAVVLLNLRMGPTGPGWLPAPVAYGVVAWWPGQTDQTSLLCSLLSLLWLDRWLDAGRRRELWLGLGAWVTALLFKEMAVCVPLLAALLVFIRGGWGALSLWCTGEGQRRFCPGLAWRVLVPGLALVAGFLALRSVLVPNAWGPQARPLGYFVAKALWYAAERPQALLISRGPWLAVVSLFLAACLYVYIRLPRRPSVVWLVMTMVIGAGLLAQLVGGNFALITIPSDMAAIGTVTLFILGLTALFHVRQGPTWPLLGMVVAVHLPVLHVQGPHYLYWPATFWGLFHASLIGAVLEVRDGDKLQWRFRYHEPRA